MKLNMIRDAAGDTTYGLPFAKDVRSHAYSTTLATGVEQTLTIPGDNARWLVVFALESGNKVWIANNQTATVPGAAFATTDSELNPIARSVKAEDVLHFISNDSGVEVGVTLYAI